MMFDPRISHCQDRYLITRPLKQTEGGGGEEDDSKEDKEERDDEEEEDSGRTGRQ